MDKLTQKQKSEKLLELQSLRVDKELLEFEQKKLNKLFSQLEKIKEKIKEQKEIISLFKSDKTETLTSYFINFLTAKGFDNHIDNVENSKIKGISVSINNESFGTIKRSGVTYDYIFKDLKVKYRFDTCFDERSNLTKEFENWLEENKFHKN